MNISEIESPNYEYVELDLLNLPRDLSTNLNEDSERKCRIKKPVRTLSIFKSMAFVKDVKGISFKKQT
jgi:hypothetical protein